MSQQLLMMAAAAVIGGRPPITVLLNNKTLSTSDFTGDVTCGYRVERNGTVATRSGNGFASYADDADEWATPRISSLGDDYEVRFTKTGGTESLANNGVWQTLTTTRTVEVLDVSTSDGAKTLTFTVQIREAGGPVLDSATISLSSQVTSV